MILERKYGHLIYFWLVEKVAMQLDTLRLGDNFIDSDKDIIYRWANPSDKSLMNPLSMFGNEDPDKNVNLDKYLPFTNYFLRFLFKFDEKVSKQLSFKMFNIKEEYFDKPLHKIPDKQLSNFLYLATLKYIFGPDPKKEDFRKIIKKDSIHPVSFLIEKTEDIRIKLNPSLPDFDKRADLAFDNIFTLRSQEYCPKIHELILEYSFPSLEEIELDDPDKAQFHYEDRFVYLDEYGDFIYKFGNFVMPLLTDKLFDFLEKNNKKLEKELKKQYENKFKKLLRKKIAEVEVGEIWGHDLKKVVDYKELKNFMDGFEGVGSDIHCSEVNPYFSGESLIGGYKSGLSRMTKCIYKSDSKEEKHLKEEMEKWNNFRFFFYNNSQICIQRLE